MKAIKPSYNKEHKCYFCGKNEAKPNKEQESLSEQESKRPKKYHPVPLEEYVKASQWIKPPRKYLNQVKNEE